MLDDPKVCLLIETDIKIDMDIDIDAKKACLLNSIVPAYDESDESSL